MSEKRFKGEKSKKNGLYIALGVCLLAVALATWVTYDAVDTTIQNEAGPEASILTEANANSLAQSKGRTEQTEKAEKPEKIEKTENAEKTEKTENTERTETAEKADRPEKEETRKTEKAEAEETPVQGSEEPAAEDAAAESEELLLNTQADAQETAAEPTEPAAETQAGETGAVPTVGTLYEISDVMINPVGGEVTRVYSSGTPVYSETMKDWRIHAGVDIAAQADAPVQACGNGQVLEILNDAMLGNTLVIEHGDYSFYYCGLGEEMKVEVGDIVSAGQEIGSVSGVPCEANEDSHLHLEVKRDEVFVNPQDVLAA